MGKYAGTCNQCIITNVSAVGFPIMNVFAKFCKVGVKGHRCEDTLVELPYGVPPDKELHAKSCRLESPPKFSTNETGRERAGFLKENGLK